MIIKGKGEQYPIVSTSAFDLPHKIMLLNHFFWAYQNDVVVYLNHLLYIDIGG